jgi:hypothetical protein
LIAGLPGEKSWCEGEAQADGREKRGRGMKLDEDVEGEGEQTGDDWNESDSRRLGNENVECHLMIPGDKGCRT